MVEPFEVEVGEASGQGTGKVGVAEPQVLEPLQVAHLGGQGAGYPAGSKAQVAEVPQPSDRGRNRPDNGAVVAQVEYVDVVEQADGGRDPAIKVVVGQIEAIDPAVGYLHPVPFLEWPVAEPVGVILPVVPAGGTVQCFERGAVAAG